VTPDAIAARWPRDRVRRFRGDFLAVGDFTRPVFMYPGMPDDLRARIRQEQKARGYTHLPFGWAVTYRSFPQWSADLNDDRGRFEALLDEVYADDLLPVVFVPIERRESRAELEARVTAYLTPLRSKIRGLSWGWEINDISAWTADGDEQRRYVRFLRRLLGPDPVLWVHWTPGLWSGWPDFGNPDDRRSEVAWYEDLPLDGVLYQRSHTEPEDRAIHWTFEYPHPESRPGVAGRLTDLCGVDFVFFEHSRNEARAQRIMRRAVTYGDVMVGGGNGWPYDASV
jgi:hypothetical protein